MLDIEVFDGVAIDTLTGDTCWRGVVIRSGLRQIYVSVETIKKINDLLKEKGVEM